MNNKDFGLQLEARTRHFAINVIRLSIQLQKTPQGLVVRNQLTKSSTSIGANYREANRSRSRADFSNKMKICESEASETVYWLEIIKELEWIDEKTFAPIMKEAQELLVLLTSISNSTRS